MADEAVKIFSRRGHNWTHRFKKVLSRSRGSLGRRRRCWIDQPPALAGDWRRLDQRIDGLSGEIEALARQDQACSRLMTVPGIGSIISSAIVAAIGTGNLSTASSRGLREDKTNGGSVFRARANTGDTNGPIEACPLIRTHAR